MLLNRSTGLIYWRFNVRKDYDFVGSYNNQRFAPINSERTINLFEYIDKNSKRPKVLLPTSGLINNNLTFIGSDITDGSRATFVFKNDIYQVFGANIFKISGITGSLIVTKIGVLNSNVGYVGIAANTYQILFVDGTDGWIWDTNINRFIKITDIGFPAKPIDVSYLDGFFVVAAGETNNFNLCNINQGLVWSDETATFTVNTVTTGSLLILGSALNYALATPVTVSNSGGGLPSPLVAATTYFVIPTANSSQVYLAATANDAANGHFITLTTNGTGTQTIDNGGELQQGSITSDTGTIVACRTLHRRLFLFSQNFTEVWENAGAGTNLPFRRTNSLLMEVGTPSVGSIATGFDMMFFLSQDRDGLGSVMMVRGAESIPMSNRALDFQLAQYAADKTLGVSDSRGILIKENGLIFYRLNFTNANHTFVLNVSMSAPEDVRWHEEEILDGDRHPAQTHAYYNGVNYYAHYAQPTFYQVDPNTWQNDGEAIRRARIGKPICPEGYNRTRIDRFHLDVLQGNVGDEVGDSNFLITEAGDTILTESGQPILLEQQSTIPGAQPTIFFSYSKDGGQSFGTILEGTMGAIGERTVRTVWRKLGTIPRGQAFVPKVEFYNNAPFVVLGAAWDFEILPE